MSDPLQGEKPRAVNERVSLPLCSSQCSKGTHEPVSGSSMREGGGSVRRHLQTGSAAKGPVTGRCGGLFWGKGAADAKVLR